MFSLSEEQKIIQETARDFAQKEAKKLVEDMDRANRFPADLPKKLAQVGLLGMKFPEKYGGVQADTLGSVMAIEEIAKVSPAIADFLISVHASSGVIMKWGTPEQKEKYLPPISSGELIPAYALTEPDAGSDLANIRTAAQRQGDRYIVNGSKTFITLAAVAELALVLAVTDPEAEPHNGMSLLLVEGFNRGKEEEFMGLRGLAVGEISFQDTPTPLSNRIGEENEGFRLVMESLDVGRIEVAALSVGLAQAALDEAVAYAKQRRQFGRPISRFQGIQFLIAEMATRIDAARLLTYQAALLKDAGKPFTREASEAKLFASDTAMQCVLDSLQIHGGYGYSKEYPIERLFRDAKINQIFEGTNQIQKLIIARSLLGK